MFKLVQTSENNVFDILDKNGFYCGETLNNSIYFESETLLLDFDADDFYEMIWTFLEVLRVFGIPQSIITIEYTNGTFEHVLPR